MTEAVLALRAAPGGEHAMRGDAADTSDESLLASVASGDEAALGQLYDRFGRVAYGLALRVLRDERLAEDAVQEAFLAVWRQAASFRPERAKAQTWVLTFVHRRAVDLVRREERRRGDPLDARRRAGRRQRPPRTPSSAAGARPFSARSPSCPRSSAGRSSWPTTAASRQSELAERLGEPLGTIKSRMFTGLKRLRELLGDEP